MKILLLHNHYQSSSPSGEDIVFDNDRLLLSQGGHEVVCYTRHNDSISTSLASRATAATSLFWSSTAYNEIVELIRRFRPDVAHFHNTFPLLSASGYQACRDTGVPVVQTLHNYRLICPGALLQRDGRPCEKCIDGSLLWSVRYACYRRSHVATGLVAGMLAVNRARGVYRDKVDRYICLTEFARQRFLRAGLPADRLVVRANGLLHPPAVGTGDGDYVLYVGRLAEEKGVETLLRAWEGVDFPLKIVGDGPLRAQLQDLSRRLGLRVTFEGLRQRSDVLAFMRAATLLVVPSEWYEGFPVTVLEALACGTPLVVSAIGALDELIDAPAHGLKFQPRDAAGLRSAVQQLLDSPADRLRMRTRNRHLFDSHYSPDSALRSLEAIYQQVTVGARSGSDSHAAPDIQNAASGGS